MKSFGLGSHAMKLEVGCHLNFTATTPTPVILMLRPRSGSEQRVGVCRDFAHLGISLCRALDLPARMVVGYLHQLEPMDLHAWFEVYTNDRWYTFDPTQAHAVIALLLPMVEMPPMSPSLPNLDLSH